jgi:hypothetical protein
MAKDNKPKPQGTFCVKFNDCIELWWNQHQFKRTVLLDRHGTNTSTIYTAPGYDRFSAFSEQCGSQAEDEMEPLSFNAEATVLPDVKMNEGGKEYLDIFPPSKPHNKAKALGTSDKADDNPDLMELVDEVVPIKGPIDEIAPLRTMPRTSCNL